MYKIVITVIKEEMRITALFHSQAEGYGMALQKATRYASIFLNEENAEYVQEVIVCKL